MTGPTAPTDYQAARVVLLDDADRVLLFQGIDPQVPEVRFWFTPGGGLEEGESPYDAAVRELVEETGATDVEWGPVIFTDVAEFEFQGEALRQHQTFFLARVRALVVDTAAHNELEQQAILGHRWWTLDELETTSEPVYPKALAGLIASVLDGHPAGAMAAER